MSRFLWCEGQVGTERHPYILLRDKKWCEVGTSSMKVSYSSFKMPPRGHQKESASESESKASLTSRAANKARNAVAAAAQLELLSKHIHSNGPKDKPPVQALDFHAFSEETLHKYQRKYNLNLPEVQTLNENILQSEIGKKTYSHKKSAQGNKISKPELANTLQKHFTLMNVRENEVITSFLYRVKNQDKEFKLTF